MTGEPYRLWLVSYISLLLSAPDNHVSLRGCFEGVSSPVRVPMYEVEQIPRVSVTLIGRVISNPLQK